MLEYALEYAKRGWSVFPLHSIGPDGRCDCGEACERPGKHPRISNGHHGATTHEPLIRYWWAKDPAANIGISLEASGLAALDVDVGEGKHGHTSLAELERLNGPIPSTPTSITGSGGLHALFDLGDAPSGRKISFLPNLDLLSKGYIVAPPSNHVSGNTYRWADVSAPLLPLPGYLRSVFTQSAPEAPPQAATPGGLPATPAILQAARERLARHGPAISGNGGDAHTFQVGAILFRGFSLTFEDAWPLALEWNATCLPPWGETELATKLRNGMSYGSGGGEERARVMAKEAVAALIPKPPIVLEPDGRRSVRLGDAARRPRPPLRWYPTGIRGLDEATGGGVASRTMTLIMGPPAVGKTGFVVGVGIALAQHGPVIHASSELETDEMAWRYAASLMGVSWTDIERGRVPMDRVYEVLDALHVRCIGCDRLSSDANENLALMTQESVAEGAALIVDYLQDMVSSTADNQRGVIGSFARSLREIAQVLDVPVIAVSSVPRGYYRADKPIEDPAYYKSAAKEAGEIDFAAATMLYLEPAPMVDDTHSVTRIAVAKARRGREVFVGARFFGASGRWEYAPEAIATLASPARREARHAEDDAAVMARVKALAATGQSLPKRDLRELCGLSVSRADQAIERLMTSRQLEFTESYYTNGGRTLRRAVVSLANASTPQANPVPLNVNAPAFSFLPNAERGE